MDELVVLSDRQFIGLTTLFIAGMLAAFWLSVRRRLKQILGHIANLYNALGVEVKRADKIEAKAIVAKIRADTQEAKAVVSKKRADVQEAKAVVSKKRADIQSVRIEKVEK